MTNADKLRDALFGDPSKTLIDLKFMLGRAKDLNVDTIMAEAVIAFGQVNGGLVQGDDQFEEAFESREVSAILA